jgi:HPt (histidine-containing phosphotransfer) domain-containing protein
MSQSMLLSMAKAIQYLGDAASAQQLLATLQSTLENEMPQLTSAIQTENFEVLQKIWHQLKGFAPVFCHDTLVAEIAQTESLCKRVETAETKTAALSASAQLLNNLNVLLAEVKWQLQRPA